ncbi:MAG: ATP-binding protein, partial [Pseudomonadota bacterium]
NRPAGLPDLNYEDHDLFRTVGRQLAVFLEQSRIQRDLTQARQFEVFNKFSAYVMHDLKNLIAQQSLVVANAKRHKDDPEFIDDAIATIDNSVKRMRRLLGQLESGRAGETTRSLDLVTLLEKVCADVSDRKPEPRFANEAGGDPMPVFGDGERLGSALQHLLRNAQDATPVDGEIVVTLRAEPGVQDSVARARIDIQDSGTGMTREFIETKLFEPFVSTKGAQGMGIGVFQARDAVQSFGGILDVDSAPGQGTTFIVSLPLLASLQEASG